MRLAAGLVLVLALALTAPPAAASGVFFGPVAFYFVAQSCSASTLNGVIFIQLENAVGVVNGSAQTSPLVQMALNPTPGGYVMCAPNPNGPGLIASGDGSGLILVA